MCGIAGIISYSKDAPPVDREELLRIRERMFSRGPDGEGLWIRGDGRIGLANRRLAIIDLSPSGSQPMIDSETGNVIVFNGEIYNYKDLRDELIKNGCKFHSTSDTEVLLYLYRFSGQNMLSCLRGMFAFAIWDEKQKGVFIARDPFGIKPLYYSDDGKTFRFASQVKALLAGGKIETSIEPAGHVGFFIWGSVPEPYTLYKNIKALPAGSSLWIDFNGNQKIQKYFDPKIEFHKIAPDHTLKSKQEAIERLKTALYNSVKYHLIADVPVGVFLSAGKDSSTITAIASEISETQLRTFTLGFHEYKGTINDETPIAGIVANHYGTKHETRWIIKTDFLNEYNHIIDAMHQPSIDGVNTYFVAKLAHDAGIKVALSGLGGDELFAGYPSFTQIPRLIHALKPFKMVPSFGKALRKASSSLLNGFTSPKYAGLLEYGFDWGGAYLLRRSLFMPWELSNFLEPEFVKEGLEKLQTISSLNSTIDGIDSDRIKISILETTWYMKNQLLRDTDWASMAHSLEIRVPYVDVDLFTTVISLIKSGFSITKHEMCMTPSRPLPEEVIKKPKSGFAIPANLWMLEALSQKVQGRGYRDYAKNIYKSLIPEKSITFKSPKVVYFHRKRGKGNYSIENVFDCVRKNIPDGFKAISLECPRPSKGFINRLVNILWAFKNQGDINHITGDVHYLTLLLNKKRTILTIHDLAGLKHYRGIKKWLFWLFWFQIPVMRSNQVTVISDFTKTELLKNIKHNGVNISIIHDPYNPIFKPFSKTFNKECPTILQIGTGWNKNLERVACALKGIPCKIVIIGPLRKKQREILLENAISFENYSHVSNEELLKFYQNCDIVVFASLYEGFGLPIIEAQAVGRPVITSNCCSMPEVGNDCVYLVDPQNIFSIREGILKIINDDLYREEIIKKGFENVKRFSPEKIACQYYNIYKKLLNELSPHN